MVVLARNLDWENEVLTSRHAGPEMRIMAIPALPGAVDKAYIVLSIWDTPSRGESLNC